MSANEVDTVKGVKKDAGPVIIGIAFWHAIQESLVGFVNMHEVFRISAWQITSFISVIETDTTEYNRV